VSVSPGSPPVRPAGGSGGPAAGADLVVGTVA